MFIIEAVAVNHELVENSLKKVAVENRRTKITQGERVSGTLREEQLICTSQKFICFNHAQEV